ncbi:GNAT family N-acetyltransferase [Mesorhizobium salmacidum]|uniref:GNAT family N-acetyltransferase n=1 Tax=Mesorhizobium salmacidum TaxID=3015171 RepID=A0ABU8KVB7_9HYPH
MAQPLAALSRSPSHTEGYSFALAGGFAAVLQKRNGGSRQRKIQSKERKMREAGVLEYGTVRSLERGNAALDFFFEQKALRLAEQGQLNSFGAPGVTDFFRDLLDRSRHMSEPLLEMAELRVGGKICAVIGSAIHRKRVNVYFMTFARDELAPQSPGQVLTFRQIAECCERGMAAYDLGVGFEDFKTHWCDVIHELDDAYVPLTSRGKAAIAAIQLGRAATDQLRRNPFLWQRLKWLRAYLARHAVAGNR